MKNKRGQFYLLASIIIITLIAGIFAVTNYSRKSEGTKVYNLAEELKIESGKFLDRSAVTGSYDWNSFTSNFSSYVGNSIEIVYIVGKLEGYEVYKYDDSGNKNMSLSSSLNGEVLTVNVEGINYDFKLKEGQNFYFIMYQYIGKEKYVARN